MKEEDIPKCPMCKCQKMKVKKEIPREFYKFECPDCGITMEIKAVKEGDE